MNELKRVGVFTRVVEAKSFSEAARQLGVAKSAVSTQISQLEKSVGVRLINRSTRKLSLTEAGEIFYRHCTEIVTKADIALNELKQYQQAPTGTLRIASPISFGTTQLIPVIEQLKASYPDLKVELLFEDRIINIVEEGVDVAIRAGWMPESNLVAKKLCDVPLITFASAKYIEQGSLPTHPRELLQHNWISLSLLNSPLRWTYTSKTVEQCEETVQMQSQIKANSVQAVVSLVKHQQGISAIAKYVIEADLNTGHLVQLLPEYTLKPLGIYAVYPHRDHVPPKVRAFIDLITERCRHASWAE